MQGRVGGKMSVQIYKCSAYKFLTYPASEKEPGSIVLRLFVNPLRSLHASIKAFNHALQYILYTAAKGGLASCRVLGVLLDLSHCRKGELASLLMLGPLLDLSHCCKGGL